MLTDVQCEADRRQPELAARVLCALKVQTRPRQGFTGESGHEWKETSPGDWLLRDRYGMTLGFVMLTSWGRWTGYVYGPHYMAGVGAFEEQHDAMRAVGGMIQNDQDGAG